MTLKKIFFLAITFLISFPNFGQQRMNELNNEKSLYLKQHSTNPVDWMPWSRNALSLAKSQKKLIIISVGYSSCHWCHVMEEETFSDEGAAKIMNEKFINIKVDREERPDIDELYMNSLVLMTGSGGWPMNIIALPDGSPIWGGTYLPKDNWINVLNQINDLYTTRYEDVLDYSKKLKLGLKPKKIIENKFASSELLIKIKKATKLSFSSVDIVNGGLRSFQKFHLPSMINYFLRVGKQFNEKKYSKFVDTTLKNISYGGINDHVEGGLHRYTVDSIWHVPHFEKMLYDNAQMLSVYAKTHRSSKKKLYKNEIDRIFNFFQNNLSGNNGLLYSSISAVTELGDEKIEGDYYVWDQETLKNILGKNFELFQDYFNVNKIGFWEKNKYVLKRENDDEFFTKKYNISIKSLESKISESLQILRKSRDGRKKPITDKKVLTSWNSLSVIGLSEAYQSTSEIKFLEKAQDILSAIENNLINENYEVQRSLSSSEDNVIFLEDYSYLISAYLSLYQSTFDNNYIDKADKLTKKALILFAHEESPFLIFSSDKSLFFSENLFVNQDGVMPSANSVMSKNLFLLSHYTGNRDYYDLGKSMIDAITNNTIENALDYMNWLNVSLDYNDEFFEVVISGKNSFEMAKEINSMYFPNILIAASKKDSDRYLLKNRYIKGENLIYVCVNNTCKFPVNNVEEALNLITQNDEKK
tara:strand:+ start:3524 stop:5623 length:2100 start_codon:yes stop_codon:yes gene_type:complete